MTAPLVCSTEGPYAYDPNLQALWTDSIEDVDEPTEAEVTGATDLQGDCGLTDIIGWEVATTIIREPPWLPFEEQRIGGQRVDLAQMVFPADRSGDDIRTLLSRGTQGYILLLPSGPHLSYPAAPMNIYPVRVAGVVQQQRLRTGQGSLLLVTFAVTARVGENVTVVGS